jgi:hypothetical protein
MMFRNETLYLFLPGSLCHSAFQDPIAISLKRGFTYEVGQGRKDQLDHLQDVRASALQSPG